MATRQNDELKPSKIVGAISKRAGVLVGTVVVTGKRIIGNVTTASGSSSNNPAGKSVQAPAKKKKKATRRKKTKGQKAKKK